MIKGEGAAGAKALGQERFCLVLRIVGRPVSAWNVVREEGNGINGLERAVEKGPRQAKEPGFESHGWVFIKGMTRSDFNLQNSILAAGCRTEGKKTSVEAG